MDRDDIDGMTSFGEQARLDALLRDGVLSEEIDSSALDRRIRAHIARERRSLSIRWTMAAACAAAMLFVVLFGYRVWRAPQIPPFCTDAAKDHSVEVIHRQQRRWLRDPKAIQDLAQRNGISVAAVSTLAPGGYHLAQGKLCRLDSRVFLHLVYAQGERQFSAYVRMPDTNSKLVSGAVHQATAGREYIAYFQTDRLMAMIVTDQSGNAALALAQAFENALARNS